MRVITYKLSQKMSLLLSQSLKSILFYESVSIKMRLIKIKCHHKIFNLFKKPISIKSKNLAQYFGDFMPFYDSKKMFFSPVLLSFSPVFSSKLIA